MRGSDLALAQARPRWRGPWRRPTPAAAFASRLIRTTGDRDQTTTWPAAARSDFSPAIGGAPCVDRPHDVAVHSLKDLPTEMAAGLRLAPAAPRRRTRATWSSPGRGRFWPTCRRGPGGHVEPAAPRAVAGPPRPEIGDIRGNIETRLGKVRRGDYDAVVLAAGLARAGLLSDDMEMLDFDRMLPRRARGLGLEIVARTRMRPGSATAGPRDAGPVTAERALMKRLAAGATPAGALGGG